MSESWTLDNGRLYIDGKTPEPVYLDPVNRPVSAWYINHIAETLDSGCLPEILQSSPPYPSGTWYLNTEENKLDNSSLPEKLYSSAPYPYTYWYIDRELGHLFNSAIPLPIPMSSFYGCEYMYGVQIPPSVKRIGDIAFGETALREVTIARDCQYNEDTSFPDNCHINFYEEE